MHATSKLDDSVFANVELDIYASSDLRPLVDVLRDSIVEMWVGRVKIAKPKKKCAVSAK